MDPSHHSSANGNGANGNGSTNGNTAGARPTDAEARDGSADSTPGTREKPRRRRRSTSHLKDVPATRAQREALRKRCEATAAKLDKSNPLDKQAMEQVARKLLKEAGEPESYLGWIMVVLASEFWRDQVAAVPPERRLLLLPHCLKHAEGCPADYDEFGLDCRRCGACSIADYRTVAEDMGYKVLVAEGSPIVMKIIVSGYIDAIVGVACLNVLEKAIDKVLLAGIPCMAVPLLSSDCRNTSVDEEWVSEFIQLRQDTPTESTRTYLHLLRASKNLFEPEVLERVLPRRRRPAGIQPEQQPDQQPDQKPEQAAAEPAAADPPTGLDPIVVTEQLAYDFLSRGGKYSRPFITLAAYDAMRGGDATKTDGAAAAEKLGDSVRRVALSIEAFHKASLIHDDIQDDDDFRYGEPTLHRQHGVGTAINVGDYLIGLGYQMVARDAAAISPEAVADILHQLSEAHTRLCEGQGAELLWRDREDKRLTTLDALKIYALKTSPAFQAALYGGVRLAGDAAELAEPIHQFSKHLGVAFQILNDLKDWRGDADNKLVAGGDVLSGRPTVLLALAFAALDEADTQELLALVQTRKGATPPADTLERVRRLYKKAGVFETADRLVDKHQERAEQIADELPVDDLRRLAYYLIDSVLERGEEQTPQLVEMARLDAKGVNANALNAGGLDARALDAKANA